MLKYRTDAIPFEDFASQYGYDELGDSELDNQVRKELEDHYLEFNAQSFAALNNEKHSDVKAKFKLALGQRKTALAQQALDNAPEAERRLQDVEQGVIKFNEDRQSNVEALGNAVAQGFTVGLADTVSGLGFISNTIAKQIVPGSEFGLDVTQFGEDLGNTFREYFEIEPDNENFFTDVARGVGQFASIFATGGLGGAATKGAVKLISKQAVKGSLGKAAGQVGFRTGMFSSAVAPQVTQLIDEYIAEIPDGQTFTEDKVNTLVASGVLIGAIDNLVPTKILKDKGFFKKIIDTVENKGVFRRAITSGSGEFITEGLQSIAADIVSEATIHDATLGESINSALDDLGDSLYEARVGGVTGFTVSLLSALLPGRQSVNTTPTSRRTDLDNTSEPQGTPSLTTQGTPSASFNINDEGVIGLTTPTQLPISEFKSITQNSNPVQFDANTPVSDLIGQAVNYGDNVGVVVQRPEGLYIVSLDGENEFIEPSESLVSATQLNITPVELSVAYTNQQPSFIDASTFNLNGNVYNYSRVEVNEDGETTKVIALDQSGKEIIFKNPDSIALIESAKILKELETSYEPSTIQQFIDEEIITLKTQRSGFGTASITSREIGVGSTPEGSDSIGVANPTVSGDITTSGLIFDYDLNPDMPDQSRSTVVNDSQTTPTPQPNNDGPQGSDVNSRLTELRESLDNFNTTTTDTSRLTRFRRFLTSKLASGGELKDSSDRSFLVKDIYDNNPFKGLLRDAELFESGVRVADVITREPIFNFQQSLRQDFPRITKDQVQVLHKALSGDVDSLQSLPDATFNSILGLRDVINNMSAQIQVELGGIKTKLEARLENLTDQPNAQPADVKRLGTMVALVTRQLEAVTNALPSTDNPTGTYVHRSYAAFIDSSYRTRIFDPNSSEYKNLLAYLSKRYVESSKPLSSEQAIAKARSDIAIIQQTVEGLKDTSQVNNDSAILNSVDALKQRQRLPFEIREFLGEIKDPSVNFANTIHQQRIILSSVELAHNLERKGLEQGWLYDRPTLKGNAVVPFRSTSNNPGLALLEGLYVPEVINTALNDYFSIPNVNQTIKIVNTALGTVKLGKTVGSAATQVRNLMSAIWTLGVNGAIHKPQHILTSVKLIQEQLVGKTASDYHQMVVKNGVAADGLALSTVKELAKDVAHIDGYGLFNDTVTTESLVSGPNVGRRLTKAAIKLYQASDDFPKIVGFETYRDLFSKAYNLDRNDPQVIELAATRVRDTYFTYSKVAKVIQELRGLPFSPPFISFPAEVYRTSKNFFKYVKEDLQSGNVVLQRNAAFRLISATATLGITYNLGEILGQLAFGDDEKESREKALMKEFLEDGKYTTGDDLQVFKKFDDGTFEVVNMSRYNPYSVISDVVGEFITGAEDFDEKLVKASFKLVSPFVQPDVTMTVINDALDQYENSAGSDFDKSLIFIKAFAKGVAPTTVNEALRVRQAMKGELLYADGSKVSTDRALARATGFSTDIVNPLATLQFKARALNDAINSANLSYPVTGRNQPSLNLDAYNNQLGIIEKEWGKMYKAVSILKELGYDTRKGGSVYRALITGKKEGGAGGPLSSELATELLNGKPFPGIKAPSKAIENLERRTKFFQGVDAANEARNQALEKLKRIKDGL